MDTKVVEMSLVDYCVIMTRFEILIEGCKHCPVYKMKESVDLSKIKATPCGAGCLYPNYLSILEKFHH